MKQQPHQPVAPVDRSAETVTAQAVSPPVSVNSLALRVREQTADAAGPGSGALEQRFQMDVVLGEGGMGKVQRAMDSGLLRHVAVKLMHRHLNWGSNQARFAREAQVTAQLEHPNIVPVYSYEQTIGGAPALVMRFVGGQTLHEYVQACRKAAEADLDKQPPHDLNSRLECLLKVCDAIQYAHHRGVLHRDLKPANIMLGEHGEVYVMDWGLAHVEGIADEDLGPPDEGTHDSAGSAEPATEVLPQSGPAPAWDNDPSPPSTAAVDSFAETHIADSNRPPDSQPPLAQAAPLTKQGDIFGTPEYMPPEQAMGDQERMGPAADQYALALILYELTYLKPARPSENYSNPIAGAVLGMMDPKEHALGRGVPRGIPAIIAKGTHQNPEERYPTVAALAADIRHVLHGEAPSVLPQTPLQKAWRRLNQDPVLAMRLILMMLVLAFVVTTASLYQVLRKEQQAAHEAAVVGEAFAAVDSRARRIEYALGQVERVVEGWARGTEQVLAHAAAGEVRYLSQAQLLAPDSAATLVESERHGQRVSFDRAVYVPAYGVAKEQYWPLLGRLTHMSPWLRRWIDQTGTAGLRSVAPDDPSSGVVTPLPLLWIYAAFEQGVLVNFPGNVNYAAQYDHRERPWYRDAKRDGAPHWNPPYLSSAGDRIQLPCTQAVEDAEGTFVGMVGVDVAVKDLDGRLRMDDLDGWRETWLLDPQARIVAGSAGVKATKPESASDRGVTLPMFPLRELRDVVLAEDAGGLTLVEGKLFVHARLYTMGWTLVAEFDEEQLLEH